MTTLDVRFKIHKRIGKGSFGEVYSGVDLETNLPVAIKMGYNNRDHLFLKEAKVLSKLRDIKGFP